MGASPVLARTGQAITAIYAVAIIVIASRRQVATTDLGLIASTAVFLVLPYAFNYDMTIVSLAVLVFAARQDHRYSTTERWIFAISFLLPLLLAPGQHYIVFGPLVLSALLWVEQIGRAHV